MTDFYRQRLAHAQWTWREGRRSRFHKAPRRKDRASGRAEKARARLLAHRDAADQRASALDEGDRDDTCTADCCAFDVPGLGIVAKRGDWLY